MFRRLLCNLGYHKWDNWKLSEKGKKFYEDKLVRRCKHCPEKKVYIGITEKCMTTGKYSPYTFKH